MILSVSLHSSFDLSDEMSSSDNFLLFTSTNGKRKIPNSHLGSMKAKSRVKKDGASCLLLYFLERQCNTLSNAIAIRTLKDDVIMTIILPLCHPPRDFIVLPFSY